MADRIFRRLFGVLLWPIVAVALVKMISEPQLAPQWIALAMVWVLHERELEQRNKDGGD